MSRSVRVELDGLVQQLKQTVDALVHGVEVLRVCLAMMERLVDEGGLHGEELDGDLPGQQRIGLGDGAQQVVEVEAGGEAGGEAHLFISQAAMEIFAQLRELELEMAKRSGKALQGVSGHDWRV
mgnify:CR=1 FL=1